MASPSAGRIKSQETPDLTPDRATLVSLATLLAGETNPDSATNGYLKTTEQVNKTAVGASQSNFAVSGGAPAYLYGIYVTASSGDITIEDGAGNADITLTAPAAGAVDLGNHGKGIRFETDITVDTAASTQCIVYWRPM